jgi:serine/threonine-protein kinase
MTDPPLSAAPPLGPHPSQAEAHDALLAGLLDRLASVAARGEAANVDALAAAHPEVAGELRTLWGTMQVASGVLESAVLDAAGSEGDSPDAAAAAGLSPVPRQFGQYELVGELGRGGMGVVYLARHPALGRRVALKLLLRGELASDEDRARLRAEAGAAARLSHPHVAQVYETGDADGQPYIAMQYVPGGTLASRLANGPLPPLEAAALLLPVCRAVAAAHAQGVLHRDLKPSNILIDEGGRPYVTDFGLARRIRSPEAGEDSDAPPRGSLTHVGALVGTPAYMAPEQAAGDRQQIGPATDVYALGAILYAMLTGRPPHLADSPIDTLLLVLEQDPPPPRLLNPQVDRELEMVALKALQKPIDLRYASADALADDLDRYLRSEPVSARSSRFRQVLSRALRPTHHAAVLENWGRLWMLHAVVVLVLCLVTSGLTWSGRGDRLTYVLLWTVGLGAWAGLFWELRRRAGPVTFVERQIAHIWGASMASSSGLFAVEWLLGLPPLTLAPVLPLIAGSVFVAKAGILSGEFYLHAALMYATCLPMALWPGYGVALFGLVSFAVFFVPGWKFDRQRAAGAARRRRDAPPAGRSHSPAG